MTVNVPPAFQSLVQAAANALGIPYNVVAAQAEVESNFNAGAVSPTGAEGWLQFEPGTYNSVAQQAGVPTGSEFNPTDEEKAYVVYMGQLISQEHGSVQDALAAYNAGPGNIQAGMGYANQILGMANSSQSLQAGSPGTQPAQTTSIVGGITGDVASAFSSAFTSAISSFWDGVLGSLGLGIAANRFGPGIPKNQITPGKDFLIRAGLILVGAIILFMGIRQFTSSMKEATGGKSQNPVAVNLKRGSKTGEASAGEAAAGSELADVAIIGAV